MRDFTSERSDVKSAETHRGLRPATPHMWTISNQDSNPNSDFPAARPPATARLRSRGSATLPGPSKPPYAARAAGVVGRCFGSSGRPETDTTLPEATSRT